MILTAIPATLGTILDRQQDVVTRGQLLGAGLIDSTIYRKVKEDTWRRLLPGVFLLRSEPPSTEQRRIAAALLAGDQCQLTGLNALHWHGFRYAPSTDKVHLLIPHETHLRSTGFVVVQRALALDEHAQDAGLYRVTSPARAVVDACRALTQLRDVRAVVAEAVQARHTSAAHIEQEIRRASRSRTALVRRAHAEVVMGVRSAPEAELRDIVKGSPVLPEALWNPTVTTLEGRRLPTPDGWFADVDLALEVDSKEHHFKNEGWATTLERHNALAEHDVQVLHLLPSEIRTVPWAVRALIERTYLARLASGVRARVIATPVHAGTPS